MQVVGYEAAVEGPAALRVAADGAVRRETLAAGTDLAYALGERHCAGAVDGEDHLACANPAAPYCQEHAADWPCARCRGNCDRPVEACHEEHAVYLAAFAPDRFKVGVTRSWRLERRLREQGAERAAHVRTVSDGRIARRVEADIAEEVGDRVRVEEKIAGLHRGVDEAAWAALLAGFRVIDHYEFAYGLSLDRQPVPATLAAGTVRGTKGRVLVLDHHGTTYAVDMRGLVGHELERGAAGDRQASLAAFE
ncbi:MAG: DUF2797 domain-containing protein [Halobacteriaceae archaeon]